MSHTCSAMLIVMSEGRNRTTEWNVRWPAIRAWGQYHSRILDRWAANAGRSEGATAVKAVPFLCAARRSFSSRSVHVASCSCLALQLDSSWSLTHHLMCGVPFAHGQELQS